MNGQFPIVLAILDGWGIAPPSRGNAVTSATTPILNRWATQYPHTAIAASGPAVGLDWNQDGNSEAGHMNLGAGRIVAQDDMRVSQAISDGTFFRNPAFLAAINHVQKHRSTMHLVGMLGNAQSAHANPDHLVALLMLLQNSRIRNVRLHLFTDGRDSPRFYAREILSRLEPHLGDARVATIMGRYYGMDRNKTWVRTEAAYNALVQGQASYHADEAVQAVIQAYNRGESDEFIMPTTIAGYEGMQDHDAIIHFNLRSDRARQLSKALVQTDFEARNAMTHCFQRKKVIKNLTFVAMTEFGPDLDSILTAYPAVQLLNTLPFVMADRRQLYIAESEKYAHVTYFFNGGYADPVAHEDRVMVSSPNVPFYDQTPAMSTAQMTDRVLLSLEHNLHDFIVMNYANLDMVAHTGNLKAAQEAMAAADACLAKLEQAVLARQGLLLVTADHGNIEEMINLQTGEVDTEHSTNLVPFYIVSARWPTMSFRSGGALGDVAPTILTLAQHAIPREMTGRSLVQV